MESFNAKFGTWKNRPFKSFIIFTGNRQFENELNDICDEIYKRYESKDFTPQSKKVKESAIKQWSDTNSIETIYMQALVGGGEVIHRVACKSVTRAGKTVIFDAFTLCNSDSTGMERASTSIYYLIEDDDLLKKYPACAKCKK